MVQILGFTMILAITLSSLRITAIYINRSAFLNLLYAVVLAALLVLTGAGVGGYEGFFQVTTELCEGPHVFSLLLTCEVPTIAECVSNLILSSTYCEGVEDLPALMQFKDLHLTEHLKEAKDILKDQPGVYCFNCLETGSMYIGSSSDLGIRLTDHVLNNSSNLHLQRAIKIYGLSSFIFIVVEFCRSSEIMAREQHWLDWLFALPSSSRYNFNPVADRPPSPLGKKRSLETREKMSAAQKGRKASEETRKKLSEVRSGENSYWFGKVPHNAVAVSIFTLDGSLIATFPSQSAAAEYLGMTHQAVALAIKNNSVVKRLYRVTSSPLPL